MGLFGFGAISNDVTQAIIHKTFRVSSGHYFFAGGKKIYSSLRSSYFRDAVIKLTDTERERDVALLEPFIR